MKITTARDKAKTGEWDIAGLQAALERGEVLPSDLAWIPGWETWRRLSTTAEELGIQLPLAQQQLPPLPSPPIGTPEGSGHATKRNESSGAAWKWAGIFLIGFISWKLAPRAIELFVDDPVSNASLITKKTISQDSSVYNYVDGNTLWQGKNKEGDPAYLVRITYDTQNIYGASIRLCAAVAFYENSGKVNWSTEYGVNTNEDCHRPFSKLYLEALLILNEFNRESGQWKCPIESEAALSKELPSTENASKVLEDQLTCLTSPQPGVVIRTMLKSGLLEETDYGADGIPVFAPTTPITVYGKPVTFVAGYQMESDGTVRKPFWRGPGTTPPHHIAVSFDATPSEIPYKPHNTRDIEGRPMGSYSKIEAGGLNYSNSGSTITCYGTHE